MTLEVKRVPFALIEHAPELPALLAEYAAESANDEIGPVCPDLPTYRMMERAGGFYSFGAYWNGQLIGILFMVTPVLPHYTKRTAVAESFFVMSAHRKTGAGTQLRQAAENVASGVGCVGIIFSAPIDGVLEKVLPGVAYRPVATAFFKALK